MAGRPAQARGLVIQRVVLLAVTALASSLILAATNPVPTAPSAPALPQTQPGLTHDEGVFLVTIADDGSSVAYFIAGNARHSISPSDMQLELQANPLWPVRQVSQDGALSFGEGAPIGSARTGLIGASAAPEAEPAPAAQGAAPAAPEAAPAEATAPSVYVLRPGDDLAHIARDYGTTVEDILAANGISDANRIYAGQSLIIPSGEAAVDTAEPAPQPGGVADGPTAVAEVPAPATDEEDAAPSADAHSTYTVVPGDSAIKIAQRFGIDQDTLLEANNISNPDRVYVGQVLTIPDE
jgi:LysM repeat protein